MDVPGERRTWQILQSNYQESLDGKKQDYISIIAKAMLSHYGKKEETHLTHEELLAKMQESIYWEIEGIKESISQAAYPMMYPYMPMSMAGMQTAAVQPKKQADSLQIEEVNEAALYFMDSFMGG